MRDYGPGLRGIPPKKLFEPFTRGGDEEIQSRPGVGLGLFLVAELTRALGGRVEAHDVDGGGGFAVDISLPLAVEAGA